MTCWLLKVFVCVFSRATAISCWNPSKGIRLITRYCWNINYGLNCLIIKDVRKELDVPVLRRIVPELRDHGWERKVGNRKQQVIESVAFANHTQKGIYVH